MAVALFHNDSTIKDESNKNVLIFVIFLIILIFQNAYRIEFRFGVNAFQDQP